MASVESWSGELSPDRSVRPLRRMIDSGDPAIQPPTDATSPFRSSGIEDPAREVDREAARRVPERGSRRRYGSRVARSIVIGTGRSSATVPVAAVWTAPYEPSSSANASSMIGRSLVRIQ